MNERITLRELVDNVNNVNLNKEIIVFESREPVLYSRYFPLRFDALLIILWKKGHGKIGIDLKEYELRPNTLVMIQPRNYIEFTQTDDDAHTFIVVVSKKVVETLLPKLTDILTLLLHHRTEPVNPLSEDEARGLYAIYKLLQDKLRQNPTPYLKQKVFSILQAALFEITDIFLSRHTGDGQKRTRKEEIMAKFIITLGENFKHQRSVSFYADSLCITTKHLSAVVREISGRTAGQWIQSYVIMEAKILLRNSDMNIQEIGEHLHFPNQSFFGKYFKHATGFAPTEYRKLDI